MGIVLLLTPLPAAAQLLGAIGGIEGLGEDAPATPILTMTGEANLEEGEGVVGVGLVYGRFTRAFGDDLEDALPEYGFEANDDRAIEAMIKVFSLSYGVTSKFNMGVSIPFSEVNGRLPVTTAEIAEEQKLNGVGNIAVFGKYQFSSEPNLAAQLAVQFPSGYEVGTDYLIVNLNAAYSVVLGDLSFHLQGGYGYTEQDRQDRDQLDYVVLNAAVARGIGDRFVLVGELNFQQRLGADDLEGDLGDSGVLYEDPPTQQSLDLTPGFKVDITDNITLAAAARIALINTLNFGYDAAYVFIAGYSF